MGLPLSSVWSPKSHSGQQDSSLFPTIFFPHFFFFFPLFSFIFALGWGGGRGVQTQLSFIIHALVFLSLTCWDSGGCFFFVTVFPIEIANKIKLLIDTDQISRSSGPSCSGLEVWIGRERCLQVEWSLGSVSSSVKATHQAVGRTGTESQACSLGLKH